VDIPHDELNDACGALACGAADFEHLVTEAIRSGDRERLRELRAHLRAAMVGLGQTYRRALQG
jgi:hypothetical protein